MPQDPEAWLLPKIVFPDISPEPRFFYDDQGCIVDGNCYWITTRDPADTDLLFLIMGTANSAVVARYHELAFQNKLYSQRRRHLTQYVQEYPLPDRTQPEAKRVISLTKKLATGRISATKRSDLEVEIDRLVAQLFGVPLPTMDTRD